MIVKRLEILLCRQGYMKLESNMPEFLMFLSGDFARSEMIQVIDLSRGYQITLEQLQSVANNTKTAFEEQGYRNFHLFTLVLTDRAEDVWSACADESNCWVVDISKKQLVISENQLEDFYGLRGILDKAMDDTYVIEEPDDSDTNNGYSSERASDEASEGVFGFIRKNYTHVNTIMVTINVIVFIVLSFMGNTENVEFMVEHGAMFMPYVLLDGEFYRLITCMFLHFGVDHLMGNMIALYFLGDNLERAVGKIKYLVIYLVSGLVAGIGSMIYYLVIRENVVSAGASGAIFGVVGAILYIVLRNKGKLEDITAFRIIIFIGFCLYSGLTSTSTDNAAHLCGLIAGFLLSVLLYRKPKVKAKAEETGSGN